MRQPKHTKKTASGLFWPCGSDQNAQIWVGGYTFPCPILNKIQHIIMDTAQTVFDRMVRAACGFESEYVREDAVDYSTVRRRVHLYARFDRCSRSEPKNVPQGLFRMFRLAEHSPRESP